MADFIIAVSYTFKKEGDRELAVKELTESGVLAAIRNEDGCLTYDYYFSADDPKLLALYEEWTSAEHQRIHMTQPHMATALEIMGKYTESVTIKRLTVSDF